VANGKINFVGSFLKIMFVLQINPQTMKKTAVLLSFFFLAISHSGIAQKKVTDKKLETDDATYSVEGKVYFNVVKISKESKKVLYRVATKIPDKAKGENFYELGNCAFFHIVGDKMFIVYDIWKGATKSKDCMIKILDTKTGKFDEPKLLYATKINSLFSEQEIQYHPIYTADNKKFAVCKDNISPTYNIDPEITVYSTSDLSVLSNIVIPARYNGQKRILEWSQFKLEDNGNISGAFQTVNEKTGVSMKSYSFEIPFEATELKDVKEIDLHDSEFNRDSNAHGQFYESFDDYIKGNPIPGIRIKNGSFSTSFTGTPKFQLLDDAGNATKEKAKDLPAQIFTYKRNDGETPFTIRMIDKDPYILLAAGKYNFYSLYAEQSKLYMAEGWDGKLKKFSQRDFEKILDQYRLLNDFKNDPPRGERGDTSNDGFNKHVAWYTKYFNLLNQKNF
jgi:hypothetical protein